MTAQLLGPWIAEMIKEDAGFWTIRRSDGFTEFKRRDWSKATALEMAALYNEIDSLRACIELDLLVKIERGETISRLSATNETLKAERDTLRSALARSQDLTEGALIERDNARKLFLEAVELLRDVREGSDHNLERVCSFLTLLDSGAK